MKGITYYFQASVWRYNEAGWYFVTVPQDLSDEIRDLFSPMEEGWGRLKVKARISDFEWSTALWYDTKIKAYLLALKADIRKRCGVEEGQLLKVEVIV